jgi:hypothetical protein
LPLVELLKDVDQEFIYLFIGEILFESSEFNLFFKKKSSTKVFTKITRISHQKKKKNAFVDLQKERLILNMKN